MNGAKGVAMVEVILPDGGSPYLISISEAREQVTRGNARWKNGRRFIVRTPDDRKAGILRKVQSGEAGPMVMQLR